MSAVLVGFGPSVDMVMKVVSGSRSPTLIVMGLVLSYSDSSWGMPVRRAANLGASARQAKSSLIEVRLIEEHDGLAGSRLADERQPQLFALEFFGIASPRQVDQEAHPAVAIGR